MENKSFGGYQTYGNSAYQAAPGATTYQNNGSSAMQKQPQEMGMVGSVPFPVDKSIPGFEINENTVLSPYDEDMFAEETKSKKPIYLAIACSVAALALVGICGFSIFNFSSNRTVTPAEPVAVTTQIVAKDVKDMTQGEKQAIRQAQDLLTSIPYSREHLIEELQDKYYGFSETEATVAVDYLEAEGLVDWNDEAVRWAEILLDGAAYSKDGLMEDLSEGYMAFTKEQAEYAMNYIETNKKADWYAEAKEEAELYVGLFDDVTHDDLVKFLVDGYSFTQKQAEYAAKSVGY
ncbi:Ltp family lipoprotein [Butyrivibrio sp. AD3002]|uniref:Ltp family lipoprotein n=1 Tax=Butyrivibrio sp. AD3002 TaxID=1280670 RepID=UPI0003B6B7B9|nr:Ltp family lipoprotein [Butyrivibrio sp. AD3002]